jgi:tRNA(fMet)-specific endonuclease VapC
LIDHRDTRSFVHEAAVLVLCLDTNAVIVSINDKTSRVRARFDQSLRTGVPVSISSIVLFELWFGAAKGTRRQQNAATIANLLAGPVGVLTFDAEDAHEAGDIHALLERAGTPIGPYDILIAAQARRRGAILVTANTREFARVPGLKTEDWT